MRKKNIEYFILILSAMIAFALSLGARATYQYFQIDIFNKINIGSFISALVIVLITIIDYLISNKIYKGVHYFFNYRKVRNRLEKQMIDAGFAIKRSYYLELPRIRLTFNKDLSKGILMLRNTLKFDVKLDKVVMSSALGKYIVERHYLTDDGNYYIYEFVDGSLSFKIEFKTFNEFLEYNKNIPTYKLFLDKRYVVKLQHCLLVGMTGSGKTYALYNLILQMLNKNVKYELYYADPKGSSLAVIGSSIAKDRTAVDVDSIIVLLENFVQLMRQRKGELKKLLENKIDSDYSTFGLKPYIFICDEYASLASVIASCEKKTRDKVKSLLYEVILQGRQLGFFLFLVMQKSDATLIDTALRDNIPLKIVLGNSEQQTYVTTFGAGVEIPNRNYKLGEGIFTEPVLAQEPKLVQCPYLNFNILQACKSSSPGGVTTRAPETKQL